VSTEKNLSKSPALKEMAAKGAGERVNRSSGGGGNSSGERTASIFGGDAKAYDLLRGDGKKRDNVGRARQKVLEEHK